MPTNDFRVEKPGDPYDGKIGVLVATTDYGTDNVRGVICFPDGVQREYAGFELRALIRVW